MNWQVDLYAALPLMIVGLGSLLLLMLEVFIKESWPRGLTAATILTAALVALEGTMEMYGIGERIFFGLVYIDRFALFVSFLVLVGSILAIFLSLDRLQDEGVESPGEYYSLYLMATFGALLFAMSAEFITFFLALEVMSMALYTLCGSAITKLRSSEAALKYFILGSFSSAFLLYGIALLYGLTGSTEMSVIAEQLVSHSSPIQYVALGLVLIGLIFKIGGAPFHFWAPDVYQGAPTSVTAYMAVVIKSAAVIAALRVMWSTFGSLLIFWSGAVWFIAVLTMTVGNLIAVRQKNVKRMLAYSSIAHVGYLLVAFLAPSDEFGGGAAILFYLIAYTVMTLGAFAVVHFVALANADDTEPEHVRNFNGIGYKRPLLGFAMVIFMLSLAGLPPGMAGMLGKFYIFNAAIKADYLGLAIIGVLNSAISCYYYLNVLVAMYFSQSEKEVEFGELGVPMKGLLTICVLGSVAIGVFPSAIHGLTSWVMYGL